MDTLRPISSPREYPNMFSHVPLFDRITCTPRHQQIFTRSAIHDVTIVLCCVCVCVCCSGPKVNVLPCRRR
jgi:hypothetical protein